MGDSTSIEWTDHTFNPWWGCSRVSPACRFCYADRDAQRYGHQLWRRHGERRMLSEANWARPLKWNRDAERAGGPARVFCASMADVFEDHPDIEEPRRRLWDVIASTPWLRWQILTKRPENVAHMAPWGRRWPGHVWLGTSVENQRYANERIPLLLKSGARTLFLSCEPLLGPVDLRTVPYRGDVPYWLDVLDGRYRTGERYQWGTDFSFGLATLGRIGWVIAGGESGPKARASHPGWFRSLRDQCASARVPFLFKQWGEWSEHGNPEWPLGDAWKSPQRHRWVSPVDGTVKPFGEFTGNGDSDWAHVRRVGKKAAGRLLDGRTWDEFPHVPEMTGAA
jgi:protein gp37